MRIYFARFFAFLYDAIIFIGFLLLVSILYTSLALSVNLKFLPYLNLFLSLLVFFFYIYVSLLTKKQTIGMKAWHLIASFETKNIRLSILLRIMVIFFTILFPLLLLFKVLNKEFLHDSMSKSKIYKN